MTARKPAELSFESWIEQQIHEAQREGLFDDLPGAGRPLAADDAADPHWWAKQLLRREQLDALLRRLNATSLSGPATTQAPLDVEALVADWRRRRAEAR